MIDVGKSRLDEIEQRLNEVMRRLSDLERRMASVERSPQTGGQVTTIPQAQQGRPAVNVEHNYLRRAIASARKEYEKNR